MTLQNPITEPQIPQLITRDTEYIAADAAHANASDPHPQYLTQPEGDVRYEYRADLASKPLAGPLNYPANIWSSLGTFAGFPLGVPGTPSAILIGISFCFDTAAPWQHVCCAALLGPVWWQPATVADAGTRVFAEVHNASGFYLSVRAGKFSGELRGIEINPESAIVVPSVGRVDVTLKRLL